MKSIKLTKHSQIKLHLLNHQSITSWEAIMLYKATRLSAIIYRLRREGWLISTETIRTDEGTVYGKYHLTLRK